MPAKGGRSSIHLIPPIVRNLEPYSYHQNKKEVGKGFYASSAGGVPNIPMHITGLIGWYKADVGTFQDALFQTPAINNGDPVGGWLDQSGLQNHLTSATGPVLYTSPANTTLNNKTGINFRGTPDVLSNATFPYNGKQLTMYYVFQMPTIVSASTGGIFSSDAGHYLAVVTNSQGFSSKSGGSAHNTVSPIYTPGQNMQVIQGLAWYTGGVVQLGTTIGYSWPSTTGTMEIGCIAGDEATPSDYFIGIFYEMIVYSGTTAHNTSQMSIISQYLLSRWGV